jgi:hypothetical protein
MGILIHFSEAVKSGDGYRGADPVMFALGDAQHVILELAVGRKIAFQFFPKLIHCVEF